MILLLMRHGLAEEAGDSTDREDARRALTSKGRRRVRDVAAFLALAGMVPDVYLTSPRLRAVQTAREVASVLHFKGAVEECEALDFGGDWPAMAARLAEVTTKNPGAIVLAAGHEPQLGVWLGQLIAGGGAAIPMRKAAVAGLEWRGGLDDSPPELLFYMTARMARGVEK